MEKEQSCWLAEVVESEGQPLWLASDEPGIHLTNDATLAKKFPSKLAAEKCIAKHAHARTLCLATEHTFG